MAHTTFRRHRTRPMVKHARFLLKPNISLYKILIKICLGMCLQRSSKNEGKMEKKKAKINTTIRAALTKTKIIKSIKLSKLIFFIKKSPLLMCYCRSLSFANHIRRSRQIEAV